MPKLIIDEAAMQMLMSKLEGQPIHSKRWTDPT
jgi:hypothetical protein